MPDKTTEGYEAVLADVDGLLRNHRGYHLAEPDPLERYRMAQGLIASYRAPRVGAFEQVVDLPPGSERVAEPARPAEILLST